MTGSETTQKKLLWALGIVVVLVYALVPVAWLVSLSLKAPDAIGTDTSSPNCTGVATSLYL